MKLLNTLTALTVCAVLSMSTSAHAGLVSGDNNTNTNTNANVNTNANANVNANNNTSKSTSDSTSKANSDSSSKSNSNSNSKSSVSHSGNSNVSTGANTNTANTGAVTNDYEQPRAASGASAPALASGGNDTCMGSTSAGAQGLSFGASFGSTWKDEDCIRRKNAQFLHDAGLPLAALALVCQNSDVAAAVEVGGTAQQKSVCKGIVPVAAAKKAAVKAVQKKAVDANYSTLNR